MYFHVKAVVLRASVQPDLRLVPEIQHYFPIHLRICESSVTTYMISVAKQCGMTDFRLLVRRSRERRFPAKTTACHCHIIIIQKNRIDCSTVPKYKWRTPTYILSSSFITTHLTSHTYIHTYIHHVQHVCFKNALTEQILSSLLFAMPMQETTVVIVGPINGLSSIQIPTAGGGLTRKHHVQRKCANKGGEIDRSSTRMIAFKYLVAQSVFFTISRPRQ